MKPFAVIVLISVMIGFALWLKIFLIHLWTRKGPPSDYSSVPRALPSYGFNPRFFNLVSFNIVFLCLFLVGLPLFIGSIFQKSESLFAWMVVALGILGAGLSWYLGKSRSLDWIEENLND